MRFDRRRLAPAVAVVVAAVCWSALLAGPAGATVGSGCTGSLNGTDVTADHDTAGTAVHVNYKSNVQYQGTATSGQTVGAVKVTIEVAGVGLRAHEGNTNGSDWSDTADVSKYAWVGIGLYQVRGTATDQSGAPICTGLAMICVDGKSPFLTVLGVLAALLGLGALYLLIRGLIGLRWRSRVKAATRFGGAGLLGGISAPLLLQQSCVVPLTRNIALGSVGGGLIGMLLLGLLIGGRRRRKVPTAPVAPPPPVQDQAERQRQQTVYRFQPTAEDTCTACKNHAAHRIYRTAEAAAADRAHPGCHCQIVPEVAHDPFVVARFAGRDVIDDRQA